MARRDPASAAADYTRAAKIVPKSPTVQFKLGAAYQALGKPDDAAATIGAIAADDKYAMAYDILLRWTPATNAISMRR